MPPGRTPDDSTRYCRHCGHPDRATVPPECVESRSRRADTRPDKDTASLLAILLGSVGAHKFYLGNTGAGVVYLLFFWTTIPALLGVVEGIVYLASSEARFERIHVDDDGPSTVLRGVQVLVGGVFLLVAVDTATTGGDTLARAGVETLAYIVLGLWFLPPIRERVATRHSLTTVGRTGTVRTARQRSAVETCASCFGVAEDGVVRRFGTEYVLFGRSLWFDAEGANHYCSDCLGPATHSAAERGPSLAAEHV